jgi:hypothetical protein
MAAQEGLTRRGLLAGILACAVAPAFVRAAMPIKAIGDGTLLGIDWGGEDQTVAGLFRGELGTFNDIKIITDPAMVRRWSEALHKQISKPSFFAKQFHFIEEVRTGPGTPYFLMPPTPWSELK